MVIKGHIYSQEDLTIEGEVDGTIDIPGHRLTIGSKAMVRADMITAKEVEVLGSLNGKIAASDKVFIRKGAALTGDVEAAGIVIEDGAYFKGLIDIRRPQV